MNCNDLEAVAGDLARGHLMDATQRENALAHAASCACCASRLADERALTEGLRFVANAANEEAPARVEAALLAVFRQQHAALPATSPARRATRRWLYAAAGVAAVALIVTLLALVVSRSPNSQQHAPQKAINPTPAVPDEPRPSSPPLQILPGSDKGVAAVQAPARRRRSADLVRNAGRSKPPADDLNKPAADAEIATDFIPLMNRETLAQMDGGQVMRVELPRSALMSFGLPMDMERAAERIKADVVVGNDGLARAIRFVR
jgi:hypothetical protein